MTFIKYLYNLESGSVCIYPDYSNKIQNKDLNDFLILTFKPLFSQIMDNTKKTGLMTTLKKNFPSRCKY